MQSSLAFSSHPLIDVLIIALLLFQENDFNVVTYRRRPLSRVIFIWRLQHQVQVGGLNFWLHGSGARFCSNLLASCPITTILWYLLKQGIWKRHWNNMKVNTGPWSSLFKPEFGIWRIYLFFFKWCSRLK